jgi:predicted DNA-binding transcriptional regulator AlpA
MHHIPATMWLNAAEVATMLGVPTSWAYRQARDYLAGDTTALPARKFGHYVRFRADEVDRWTQSQGALLSAPEAANDRGDRAQSR